MKVLLLLGLIGLAAGGHVSVRMPYLNPAGVTYTGLSANVYSPLLNDPSHITAYSQYSPHPAVATYSHFGSSHAVAVTPSPVTAYSHLAAAPAVNAYSHLAAPALAVTPAPVTSYSHVAAAPALTSYSHLAAPAVAVTPAPVTTYSHVAAAPAITAYSHLAPAVAVTPAPVLPLSPVRVAHPGFIRKVVDVAKPGFAARNLDVRRPAVHKQFYDVEHRVTVRPAGSALLELDHPGWHAGPTVVTPGQPTPQPAPQQPPSNPQSPSDNFQLFDDSDSVSVDNPELARSAPADPTPNPQDTSAAQGQGAQSAQSSQQTQAAQSAQSPQFRQSTQFEQSSQFGQPRRSEQPAQSEQTGQSAQPSAAARSGQEVNYGVEFRSLSDLSLDIRQLEANQARLIELLTGRGGVTEISDPARVRARVLSVEEGRGVPKESVSTRRVVVNRPVHTVQRVQVLQPFTKYERLAYDHPATIVKTAHAAPLLAHPQYTYLHH